MSNGDLFPSPTHALPLDSGGQDRSRTVPILSEINPGAVGAGRVWIVASTGAAFVRSNDNTTWQGWGGIGTVPAFGAVGDIVAETIAATASAGATGKMADAAHRHAMPAAGAPAAEILGSVQTTGAAGTFADSAHVHALAASARTPLVESGTGSAGTSTTASRDDHVHPASAVTFPRTIRGSVAANGSITAGTGFTVTHNATGDYTVTFTTPFAAPPIVVATGSTDLATFASDAQIDTAATAAGSVRIRTGFATVADEPFTFIAIEV